MIQLILILLLGKWLENLLDFTEVSFFDQFGGGRVIRPGEVLETEEEKAAKEARTRQLVAAYKSKMGLNIDPKLRLDCEKVCFIKVFCLFLVEFKSFFFPLPPLILLSS